jgi:hypothetical protein
MQVWLFCWNCCPWSFDVWGSFLVSFKVYFSKAWILVRSYTCRLLLVSYCIFDCNFIFNYHEGFNKMIWSE